MTWKRTGMPFLLPGLKPGEQARLPSSEGRILSGSHGNAACSQASLGSEQSLLDTSGISALWGTAMPPDPQYQ